MILHHVKAAFIAAAAGRSPREERMKRFSVVLLAFLFLSGFAGCKETVIDPDGMVFTLAEVRTEREAEGVLWTSGLTEGTAAFSRNEEGLYVIRFRLSNQTESYDFCMTANWRQGNQYGFEERLDPLATEEAYSFERAGLFDWSRLEKESRNGEKIRFIMTFGDYSDPQYQSEKTYRPYVKLCFELDP